MILKPKSCSFPLQRYGCCKNHFCIHVNGDVNFDKLVHENMFYSVIVGFPKSGHIYTCKTNPLYTKTHMLDLNKNSGHYHDFSHLSCHSCSLARCIYDFLCGHSKVDVDLLCISKPSIGIFVNLNESRPQLHRK